MKVQVEQIDGNKVLLATSIGFISGIWDSKEIMPEAGYEFDAEVDIDIAWNEISKTLLQKGGVYRLNTNDGRVILQGTIDDFEDDVIYFRLSRYLVMLSTDKVSCKKNEWYELSVDSSSIRITPFG
jgi:hypothetical protein